jgi:heterodisulfide reductase subunit C
MNRFGYSLSKARVIDYDANNHSVAEYIVEKEPSFRLCIACGGCAATCTTGNFTEFSLREINVLIHRGENRKPASDIRKCMLCGKCILVCPRGVNTRNVVITAREAFKKFGINAL